MNAALTGKGFPMVKVGDFVSWGSAGHPNALKFTGCQVLELGQTADGRQAAKLNCGRYGEANALVSDLEIETPTETVSDG